MQKNEKCICINFHYVYSLNIVPSAVKQVYVSTTFDFFFKLMCLFT